MNSLLGFQRSCLHRWSHRPEGQWISISSMVMHTQILASRMVSKCSKEISDNLRMLKSADEIPTRRGARIPASFGMSIVTGSHVDMRREIKGQMEFYNIMHHPRTITQNCEMKLSLINARLAHVYTTLHLPCKFWTITIGLDLFCGWKLGKINEFN